MTTMKDLKGSPMIVLGTTGGIVMMIDIMQTDMTKYKLCCHDKEVVAFMVYEEQHALVSVGAEGRMLVWNLKEPQMQQQSYYQNPQSYNPNPQNFDPNNFAQNYQQEPDPNSQQQEAPPGMD
jgi:hypothetical protein